MITASEWIIIQRNVYSASRWYAQRNVHMDLKFHRMVVRYVNVEIHAMMFIVLRVDFVWCPMYNAFNNHIALNNHAVSANLLGFCFLPMLICLTETKNSKSKVGSRT